MQCTNYRYVQCTDDIKGTVTLVNTDFGYFEIAEIDNTRRVYMSIMLARGRIKNMPLIGSKVRIRKGHMMNSIYIVCLSSTVEGNFQTVCPMTPFLFLIKTYKLSPKDIAKFTEISDQVENNFTNLEMQLNDILLSLFQNLVDLKLAEEREALTEEDCNNCIIFNISLATIKTCKYVEIAANKYSEFPYWSFGIHPNDKNGMLFGYLEINPMYGFYMIKDSHYQMACIITGDPKAKPELFRLNNSYILIRKYTIITEVYNENNVPNVEYIVATIDDVDMIHLKPENSTCEGVDYPYVMSFVVVKKSTVCAGIRGSRELFLKVFIRFNSAGILWEEVFFILPSKYVCYNIELKEGSCYIMYYKVPLKEVVNLELTRLQNLKIYKIPIEDCYMQLMDVSMCKIPQPLSVLECKQHIKVRNDLVTFRGIIRKKRFTNPLSSRTAKIPAIYGFGTPGGKVHQIVFSNSDDNNIVYLDCYLNNWENMLMPLGLIPDMEVIVRDVRPQSHKYLKSTIFTTFEVVAYKPSLPFNTANLYEAENEYVPWSRQSFLSQGNQIPVSVLVWGKVTGIFMIKLFVSFECVQCKETVDASDHCNKDCELKFFAKFNVSDPHGQGSVSTKSLNVFRILLNMKPADFNKLIATFKNTGNYSYNFFDKGMQRSSDFLTTYLGKLGEGTFMLDLKCRKMSDKDPCGSQRPLWFCIDARKC